MSDDVTRPDGGPPEGTPMRGRRKLWVAAGVAGLTGVVGLAALGGLAARDDKSGAADRLSDAQASAPKQNVSDAGRADEAGGDQAGKGEDDWSGDDWSGGDRSGGDWGGGKDDRKHDSRVKEVPCDTDKLIQAITDANKTNGATLKLAKHCTYELTRSEHGNGLPVIKESIVLKGEDTRIVRAAEAERFRILNVGSSGHLTLKDVTVKGGQTVALKMVPAPVRSFELPEPTEATAEPARKPAMAAPKPPAAASETPAAAASGTSVTPSARSGAVATAQSGATVTAMPGGTVTAVPDGTVTAVPDSADGAGILVQQGGRADIEHSRIVQNHAGRDGGGIANFGTTNIRHTAVEENSANGFGGGIFNVGVLRVEESKVSKNSARLGGGGIANGTTPNGTTVGGGTVWVWKSAISHNRTSFIGGGVFDNQGDTTITQSEITGNTAGTDAGGLVAFSDSRLSLEKVVVAKNYADDEAGGIGVGGGSNAVIEHSVIKENVAGGAGGGGLFNDEGTVTLRDSEVLANQAVGESGVGGGIVNDFGRTKLISTKVAHNVATQPPGGIFTNNDGVLIDRKSAVTDNRPTNCKGSPVIPDRCFG
ncbi:right-handed parallel beta-helix repeat-containing protein [Micromonospora peucetia]|uniref:right-handed parallel beta-helix repeat-containing protein n=1 Tax=Micromonospora peucetia TaxID=47871 RepID=UPI0022536437|nr:right-handed parallel beta-helix repeat-containing protein [Micromonospora peucetia]MCX4388324.1 right-handed parallel beta-helix repeat-containing protein [Micromonospora peucetia]